MNVCFMYIFYSQPKVFDVALSVLQPATEWNTTATYCAIRQPAMVGETVDVASGYAGTRD